MNKKQILHLSSRLLVAFDGLQKNLNEISISNTNDLLQEFGEKIKQDLDGDKELEVQPLLYELTQIINTLHTTMLPAEALGRAKETVDKLLRVLTIQPPDTIFLLTAPFDENARTGDGQYAQSLVEGFKRHSPTKCTWLKQKDQHYTVPCYPGLQPIPEGTIPSVYVLQPVANEHTVLSGYCCETTEMVSEAIEIIKDKITLRTPQILLDSQGKLTHIGLIIKGEKIILNREMVQERWESVQNELRTFDQEHLGLSVKNITTMNEKCKQYKAALIKSLAPSYVEKENNNTAKVAVPKTLEEQEKLFQDLVTLMQEHGISVPTSSQEFMESKKKTAILSTLERLGTTKLREAELVEEKRKKFVEAATLLTHLHQAFNAPHRDRGQLVAALEQLSGIQATYYDYQQNCVVDKQPVNKPNAAAAFYEALKVAKADPHRQSVIKQIISSMLKGNEGKKLGIDIHVRVPDTSAFIMPEDIELFKQHNIRVNVTVHEYKQNYTRRFLQKMTHDLLRHADSVLFFNEKDKKNAVKASQFGDLDYERRLQGHWPVEPYPLKDKVGLTVASQVLSGDNLLPPEEVIQKQPNILSFGTIRPGKGFEEVLELAKELKALASEDKLKGFSGIVLIAGDPQSTKLMENLFAERYGLDNLKEYQKKTPTSSNYKEMGEHEKRMYWQKAKAVLEQKVQTLNNPYLELHPWCNDLDALKNRSKYVYRMDDMGMRNNGSAIISVLNTGIVYANWGCTTDHEFTPEGIHGQAVDIGKQKYGVHHDEGVWLETKKIDSNYKRLPKARDPKQVLASMIEREQNQQEYAEDLTQSTNYKTVVAAQRLLREKFTLQNAVFNLQQVYVAEDLPAKPVVVDKVIPVSPVSANRYEGIRGLESGGRFMFFAKQHLMEAQRILAVDLDEDKNRTDVVDIEGISTSNINL